MTERTVTIRLGIQDEIGNSLLEIRKQRDALLSRSTVNLRVNADGIDQVRKASAQARPESAAAVKDLGALGEAITSKAVAPLAQYQELLGSALKASRALAASATILVGFAAAAGLSSKHAQNYITSTLSSRLMERKLSDKAGAEGGIPLLRQPLDPPDLGQKLADLFGDVPAILLGHGLCGSILLKAPFHFTLFVSGFIRQLARKY